MKEKINIAELLKDCPGGMELDCTMYDNLYFDSLNADYYDTINCYTLINGLKTSICFTKYGTFNDHLGAKCVIFPKGKTTWEGFVPPCMFKDGDILAENGEDDNFSCIFIVQKLGDNLTNLTAAKTYCTLYDDGDFDNGTILYFDIDNTKLATEEEKQKLFQAIKENGYKWNAETKTLEKLVEPRFKVGDRVKKKKDYINGIITNIDDVSYRIEYKSGGTSFFSIEFQDDLELISDKFDIATLKPFESRVLVRTNKRKWVAAFYSHYDEDASLHYCVVGGLWYEQCIPYNGNEHLLNTTDDCDEYYKNWEE